MPTPFEIKHQNLPTVPAGQADYQVEGHVFDPDSTPWLAHLVIHGIRKRGAMGFSRNALAALLKFVAEHDPEMYRRMGEFADRERQAR